VYIYIIYKYKKCKKHLETSMHRNAWIRVMVENQPYTLEASGTSARSDCDDDGG